MYILRIRINRVFLWYCSWTGIWVVTFTVIFFFFLNLKIRSHSRRHQLVVVTSKAEKWDYQMARGLILTTQARATTTSFTTRLSVSKPKCKNPLPYRLHLPSRVSSTRFFCCKCSVSQDPIVITEYKQSFSQRMAMAGLKPHHRIGQYLLSFLTFSVLRFQYISQKNSS